MGVVIDTRTMTFHVPPDKVTNLKEHITRTLRQKNISPKELAKLAGELSSMHQAIGPLVRLFTRQMYRQIAESESWYQHIPLTAKCVQELHFWLQNIADINGYTFKPRPITTQMMFTDAGESGYGGFMVNQLEKLVCCGKFTEYEKQQSSTFRELLAVKLVLQGYGTILKKSSNSN